MTIRQWLGLFAIVTLTNHGISGDSTTIFDDFPSILENSTLESPSVNNDSQAGFFEPSNNVNETLDEILLNGENITENNGFFNSGESKETSRLNVMDQGSILARDKREKKGVDGIMSEDNDDNKETLNQPVTSEMPKILNNSTSPTQAKNSTTDDLSIDRPLFNEAKRNNESAANFRMLLDEDDEEEEEEEEEEKRAEKAESKKIDREEKKKGTVKDKKDKGEDKKEGSKNNKRRDEEDEEKINGKKSEEEYSIKILESKAKSMINEFKKLPKNRRKTVGLSFDRFLTKTLSKSSNEDEGEDDSCGTRDCCCNCKCDCGYRTQKEHENSSTTTIPGPGIDFMDGMRRTIPEGEEIESGRFLNTSDGVTTTAPLTGASSITQTTIAPSTEASSTERATEAPLAVASSTTRTKSASKKMVQTTRRKDRKKRRKNQKVTVETPTARKKCNKRRKSKKNEETTSNIPQEEKFDEEHIQPPYRGNFDDPEEESERKFENPEEYDLETLTRNR